LIKDRLENKKLNGASYKVGEDGIKRTDNKEMTRSDYEEIKKERKKERKGVGKLLDNSNLVKEGDRW
jgi:hypothetical protein